MRIAVVCQGSAVDGLGHLFRARTFAAASAAAGHEVLLVAIADDEFAGIFDRTARVVSDAGEAAAVVAAHAPEVVVFDMLRLAPDAFAALGRRALTVSISPIFDRMAQVDLYVGRVAPVGPPPRAVEVGLRYAIFNRDCVPIPDDHFEHALDQDILSVAVSMGGGDAANATRRLLEALSTARENGQFWVLTGHGYGHSVEDLFGCVRPSRRHEIIVARTNRSMWRVMRNCAVGIVAGGLSFLEAVYAGLPTISVYANDLHEQVAAPLPGCGIGLDARTSDVATRLPEIFDHLSRNRDELRAIRQRCRGILDDRGSERVLERVAAALPPRAVN